MKIKNKCIIFKYLALLLAGIITVAGFFFILFNRFPSVFRPISVACRFGFTLVAPIILFCLVIAFRPRRWIGVVTTLIAVFLLFSLALAGLWASGKSEPSLINGLLPLFDPGHYYLDALGWLQGFGFSEQSAMRPIFISFLSLLLSLTGRDLQVTTGILTFLLAFLVFVYAIKTRQVFGSFIAAFSVFILFLYSRRFLGITFSENLGLVFSLLGFTALWIGSRPINHLQLLLGFFMVSLSLNIRPGPFFVLIGLLVWFWFIRADLSGSKWESHQKEFLILVICALGAPFIINMIVQKITSPTDLIPFANFSYAFYGLVNGGQSFAQALVDNPDLVGVNGNEHYLAVFRAALETLARNPIGLLQGCWHHWRYFLWPDTWYSIFGYVDNDSPLISITSRSGLEILSIFVFVPLKKFWQDPNRKLIALVMLTTLLSVPFVPPTDAHKLRLYASVIPIIALLPGLGLVNLLQMIIPARFQSVFTGLQAPADIHLPDWTISILSVVLTVVMALSPILSALSTRPARFDQIECTTPQQAVYFLYDPGSYLNIFRENEFFLDWTPNIHIGAFKLNLHGLPPDTAVLFEDIQSSSTLIRTINLLDGKYEWVVIETNQLPVKTGTLVAACGHPDGILFEIDRVVYTTNEY